MTPLLNGSLDGLDVWGRPDDVADDDSYFRRGRLLHVSTALRMRPRSATPMRRT